MNRDPISTSLPAASPAVPLALDMTRLEQAYREGTTTPTDVAREVLRRCALHADNPLWITRVADAALLARAAALAQDPAARTLPLYGIPFAVKDNIDVAGLPTTAACEAFRHLPERTATAVARLLDAGAMLVGKTNLDQFATGLVGTRSPFGEVRNAFDAAYVSGGSSSGSAAAVALGLASFALGTDTAGSGRIPAAFNNIVGLKPTRGIVSTRGVLPACRSLDCVSIFALDARDASRVLEVLDAFDGDDDFARHDRARSAPPRTPLRVGVPRIDSLDFFGDGAAREAFVGAVERLDAIGATRVEIDIAPFIAAAELLYGGPWVAERHAAVRALFEQRPDALLPVIRRIVGEASRYTATDTFEAMYRLAALRRASEAAWQACDTLLLPTAGTVYTRAEIAADPLGPNARLGRYTNFVNLLDLAAIAVPAAFRADGLPFGVSFIAPAGSDRWLCALASTWQHAGALPLGATGERLAPRGPTDERLAPPAADSHASLAAPLAHDETAVAVVGAHLTGEPLNHQLTDRGARLLRASRTTAAYRLYVLAGTTPPKPGLVRTDDGAHIYVEVWAMPTRELGGFVSGIPAPLGIGTIALDDGTHAHGFVCEAYAIVGAEDISHHGGWRAYLAARRQIHHESTRETS
jgi:allophanate hydrolase